MLAVPELRIVPPPPRTPPDNVVDDPLRVTVLLVETLSDPLESTTVELRVLFSEKVTVPLPVPLALLVISIHAARLTAVQRQPASAVKEILP